MNTPCTRTSAASGLVRPNAHQAPIARRWLAFLATATIVSTVPKVALATPEPQPVAEQSYEEGRALFKEGKFMEAADAFNSAYADTYQPNLLYNISLCYDRADELELALEYLEKYIAVAPKDELSDLERDRAILEERLAARELSTSPQSPAPAFTPTPDLSADRTTPPPRVMTPAAISLLAIGGAGLLTGTGLAVVAGIESNRANEECSGSPSICTETGADAQDRARQLALGADISFGIGAGAALAGIVLVIVNATNRARARKALNLAVAPVRGGVSFSGRF